MEALVKKNDQLAESQKITELQMEVKERDEKIKELLQKQETHVSK
jgi:hypothetical protein